MDDRQTLTAVGVVLRAVNSLPSLNDQQCRKLLAGTGLLRRWLDGVDNQTLERLSDLVAESTPAGRPVVPGPAIEGALSGCLTRRDAKAAVARAKTGKAIPALGEALNAGQISGAHVDAVTKAAASLQGDERDDFVAKGHQLLEAAKSLSPDELLAYPKTSPEESRPITESIRLSDAVGIVESPSSKTGRPE